MALQHFAGSDARLSRASLCLVEEITRRVVDEYAQAVYALALGAAATADAVAQATLASIAIRLRAQGEAHRALQGPAADGPMDLTDYVARVCACLSRSSLAGAGVRVTVDADEIWLDADRCWRVGLIIAELIREVARHGFSDGPGTIWLEIAEVSGRIRCLVCDDRHSLLQRQSSRSRDLVQALATELSGSIDWSFPPAGCIACLEFPIAVAGKSVASA